MADEQVTTTKNGDVLHIANGEKLTNPDENEPTESQRLLETLIEENADDSQTNGTLNEHAAETNETTASNDQPNSETNDALDSNGPQICEQHETNLLTTAFGSITTIKSADKTKSINCRTILWYLAFFGFIVNYLFRININIAIVGMVAKRKMVNNTAVQAFCAIVPMLNSTFNHTDVTNIRPIIEQITELDDPSKFHWDEVDQGKVLGSFFLMHWLLQIPSGVLAQKYGTKIVFGFSNFITCVICFAIPTAAYMGINWLVGLRIIQGIISSLCWPAMHHLTAQWIPPNERSKFLTSYLGGSVCIALFYPIFGFVVSAWSWEWVFYITGFLGIVWYAAWLYFVYDSPAHHPRIDPMEKLYIEECLEGTLHDTSKISVPWRAICTSKPLWINIIGQFGGVWGLVTIMTQGPTYFHNIFGWSVQMTGLLSGIPQILRLIFAYVFSLLVDHILLKEWMTRSNARKFAGGVSILVNGIVVLGAAYAGCNSVMALVLLSAANMLHGAVSSGPLASLIDMSPNYSGITMGLAAFVVVWPGFISPYIVGKLTLGNQSVEQWHYVFLITAIVLIVCGGIFVIFGDSSLQSWNQVATDDDDNCEKGIEKEKPKNGTTASEYTSVKDHDDYISSTTN